MKIDENGLNIDTFRNIVDEMENELKSFIDSLK